MLRHVRLHVNIDHVATVRQARRAQEPSLGAAAALAELAGADGITVHLRADRRHIQDDDVRLLRRLVTTHLNMEMAPTDEMLERALELRPDTVTLVPESPDEVTTEGGLDLIAQRERAAHAVKVLADAGLDVSVFIEPEIPQIEAAAQLGAKQVELCTARYAELTETGHRPEGDYASARAAVEREADRHAVAARDAATHGMRVAAGHGLTYRNVGRIVRIQEVEELNIGHNIVSRAVLVGLDRAVREMREAVAAASR
jgi:pyridoxine 5-phosphate synthase